MREIYEIEKKRKNLKEKCSEFGVYFLEIKIII